MDRIAIFDTSIATLNVGDEIIMDAVYKEVREIFPQEMFNKVSTHERLGRTSWYITRTSKYGFVGGSNLLSSNMFKILNQWNISMLDAINFNNVILMGPGWQNRGQKINIYTKYLYKKALSKNYLHAVRDSESEQKLKSIGINNVINTGCPTLWKLDKKHCNNIPKNKAKNVICTFTDYCKNIEKDKKLAEILFENYENVYCWIQGSHDYEYIKSISNDFIFVNPNLASYDELLESEIDLDYVGTRLHAGIRAMQKGRRSIIVVIDNRAREMGKDIKLNVIERDNIEDLSTYINEEIETKLEINWENIDKWKKQFIK